MSECVLFEEKTGIVHFNLSGKGSVLEILRVDLTEGKVFDKSDNDNETIRVWVSGNRIYVLHLFGHDIRWPNTVYEFTAEPTPIDELKDSCSTRIEPLCCTQLHEWLAKGRGIPSA